MNNVFSTKVLNVVFPYLIIFGLSAVYQLLAGWDLHEFIGRSGLALVVGSFFIPTKHKSAR